ncbi:MAG: phosphatidylserine decarboxylase, partial [Elusimicrobia bacterium]|nr:phosphatidylserine decarboxylase [Elusimicrobiota bacterium]
MKIAQPGKKFVYGGLGIAGACILASFWIYCWFFCLLAGAAFVFSCFSAYFFRDPERPVNLKPEEIPSPADGIVLSVRREGPADVVTIRIFLAIWNVHVQRAPIGGRVEKIHYQPGNFALAMKPEAVNNERNSIRIGQEGG